jgi:hypothetical protein
MNDPYRTALDHMTQAAYDLGVQAQETLEDPESDQEDRNVAAGVAMAVELMLESIMGDDVVVGLVMLN